jgi:hypothetical protein
MNNKQLILSGSPAPSLLKNRKVTSRVIKSSGKETVGNGTNILLTLSNVVIGSYDVPTINQQIYPLELWKNLESNEYWQAIIEEGCCWMEADHTDKDYTSFHNGIPARLREWRIGTDNLVYGDIDFLNTSIGRDMTTLAHVGTIGASARGFGALQKMPSRPNVEIIVPEDYIHVSFDLVSYSAVPEARFSANSDYTNQTAMIEATSDRLKRMVSKTLRNHNSLESIAARALKNR